MIKNKVRLIIISMLVCSSIVKAQNKLESTGNVGIGTLNPVGNLDVFSSINTTTTPLFSIRSDFHTVGNYGMIKFGDYTQTTDYQKGAIIYESVAGSARGKFHIALENSDSPESVKLSDSRVTILSDGNVGIGTMTPSDKLSVNGNIRAREIKVDSEHWPDYVFEKNYKKTNLSDLEVYISTHKHLPDMPSAKEVESNGLELGEMVKMQQKKIEELTLYLIEMKKELTALKETNLANKNK
ncbi:hypothetical protein ACJVDH_05950 [Pedobacter sp. AW1-32]|uniref:hypothetical protein n=1 Tax=Pedobacter sp. AW1-32 TaxID=3383026 RepID=UPI003FEF00AF